MLFEVPGPSGTLVEQPAIVDVDNDGRVEIVFAVNNYAFPDNAGIEVYGNDTCWPNAREIWNQHTYHITNINYDASAPTHEIDSRTLYNNFHTQYSPPRPRNRCGDFNLDLNINLLDGSIFVNNWLWEKSAGDTYNIADLNCDGIVNLKDFSFFGIQWMNICPLW